MHDVIDTEVERPEIVRRRQRRIDYPLLDIGLFRQPRFAAAICTYALTSFAIAARPFGRRIGPALLGSVSVFGLATIVLGLTRSYAVAFVALLVLSAADAVSVYIRSTIVPIATPEHMRGRVLATEQVVKSE